MLALYFFILTQTDSALGLVPLVSSQLGDRTVSTDIARILRKKEVLLMVPYSAQHLLRLEKQGKFPKRIRIGERRVEWRLSEIEAWLEERSRIGHAPIALAS
jgi:prophage regulatory protein